MTTLFNRQPRHFATQLAGWFVLMIVAPLVVVAEVATDLAERSMKAAAAESVRVLQQNIADKAQQFITERAGDVQAFALNPLLRPGASHRAQTDYLHAVKRVYRIYDWIGLADARGRLVAATDPQTVGLDVGGAEWFRRGRQGLFVQDCFAEPMLGGAPTIGFSQPVRDGQGRVVAVISTRLSMAPINAIFAQGRMAESGETYALNRAGLMLTPSRFVPATVLSRHVDTVGAAAARAGEGVGTYPDYRSIRVIGAYGKLAIHDLDWRVLSEIDEDEAMAPAKRLRLLILAVAAVAALVATTIATRLASNIVRPLGALAEASARFAAGGAPEHVHVQRRDEFGLVAQAYNRMVDQVGAALEGLRQRNATIEAEIAARTRDLIGEQRFKEVLLNAAADGILGLDADSRVTFANPAASALLGHPQAALIGAGIPGLLGRPVDRPHEGAAGELEYRHPDGQMVPLEYTSTPLHTPDGLTGFVVNFRDVSERREQERLQAERLEALAAADELKSQFLGMVSHELRTPISVLMSSVSLLRHAPHNPELQAKVLARLERGSRTLLDLLNDLLDASQIQAGTFQLNGAPVAFYEVLHETVEELRPLADERGIVLTLESGELPPLWADAQRLAQVLRNLLHNALKFTPEGGLVRVRAVHQGDEVRCEVVDAGPGLDADELQHLFQRFSRLPKHANSDDRGVGLGLFICRSLIEAHGGTIGVTSVLGEGANFWFTLPLARHD